MNATSALASSQTIASSSAGEPAPPEEIVPHERFAEGARGLRERHPVPALAVREVAHHPRMVCVAELVGEGDDVARAARIGHVDARGAGLVEAGAVGTGALALTHRPLDPASLRHHPHELAYPRLDRAVRRGDEVHRLGVRNRRPAALVATARGSRRPLIPGPVLLLAVRPRLEPGGAAGERNGFPRDPENRVQGRPRDAVEMQGGIQEVDGPAAP